MSFYNELKKFIVFSDKQLIGQGIVGGIDYNHERKKDYNGLSVESKVGAGRASRIPWISFLSEYDSVKKGIYPVYLYFKEKELLILAYGISESNLPERSWNLQNGKTIKEYFAENGLGEPTSYGGSFVYKVYDLKKELVEEHVDKDLNALISIYKKIPFNGHKKEVLKEYQPKLNIKQVPFDINSFKLKTEEAGLIFSTQLIQRFVASLCTKPFVICSGLSGSGKTKLAQAFVQWICESDEQYKLIPVGADWTNREPLLGYPNGLGIKSYVTPDTGALQLILEATKGENQNKPYFMILDEMNLSHVERYFADFLSIMESGDKIKLYSGTDRDDSNGKKIDQEIIWPKNLFIIGTVNIDETTYMFSPKVLDRANTIEFRLTEDDLLKFIASDKKLEMNLLKGQGLNMSEDFMTMALKKTDKNLKPSEKELNRFFTELKKSGAEFGYRTASEIGRLMYMLKELGESGDNLLDIAIMQKLLPKLHGSRNKLTKVLPILGGFCLKNNSKIKEEYLDKFVSNSLTEADLKDDTNIKYKISFQKICRMYKNAIENGFASYPEA